jgi:hypothetical protein
MDFTKEGTTSVKVHHAPGGKSSFSLAWDTEPTKPTNQVKQAPVQAPTKPLAPQNQPTVQPAAGNTAKTSVKVHNPPGGKSSIFFG